MQEPVDRTDAATGTGPYLQWGPVFAGALSAAAVFFVLITFGTGIGFSVASPSPSWRDASAALAFASGLWILLVALGSFALGGYLAGRMRAGWSGLDGEEREFRDGVHGLVTWALAVCFGALFSIATAQALAPAAARLTGPAARSTSSAETFYALELDRLFRSERRATEGAGSDARAEAARILASGSGRRDVAPDDRTYLVRLVASRTGLSAQDADRRVGDILGQAKRATQQARRSAVLIAFMSAAALAGAAAAAWFAAIAGGRHRDHGAPSLSAWDWRHPVDRAVDRSR